MSAIPNPPCPRPPSLPKSHLESHALRGNCGSARSPAGGSPPLSTAHRTGALLGISTHVLSVHAHRLVPGVDPTGFRPPRSSSLASPLFLQRPSLGAVIQCPRRLLLRLSGRSGLHPVRCGPRGSTVLYWARRKPQARGKPSRGRREGRRGAGARRGGRWAEEGEGCAPRRRPRGWARPSRR